MAKDAVIFAAVSLALAIPLVGFYITDQGSTNTLHTRFGPMFYGVGVLFLGKLALSFAESSEAIARRIALIGSALAVLWFVIAVTGVVQDDNQVLGWFTWIVVVAVAVRGWVESRRSGAAARAIATAEGTSLGAAVARLGRFLGPLFIGIALVAPFYAAAIDDKRLVDLGVLIFTYIMLGWGLNVVVGLAGLLDLGYVAFYAVGAYTYAVFSVKLGLNFWETLPVAGALAASFGILLGFPVLRLRGDYLAIVTLGFGEIIRIILLNWAELAGGAQGIGGIERPSFFGMPFTASPPEGTTSFNEFFNIEFSPMHRQIYLYYIILLLALLTNWFTLRIRKLPIGRAWEALREDEIACRALGINPTNTKLTAFAIGAMFGGFAGSFFATRQGFISPESFNFLESAIILAIVVLGGMGSQIGVVIATIVLIGGPEWFRDLAAYRMLAFGGLMVLIMIWRPEGLLAHREPTIRMHSQKRSA
ncbi:MAG: high-affinity branched-chain amino acid ABC transporter permease LivM [Alphaproteobacteria bacterium]|nr:high-affinity branched-chain amino acid ABC transporter permease LivM [Alphaproteobacteria bacterium]